MRFTDRVDAGRRLAPLLEGERGEGTVVLGIPRGGVPVAAEVARALGAPLDVIVVRKLGVPWRPELAMGAVGEGGVTVLDERIVTQMGVSQDEVAAIELRERTEVQQRVGRWRRELPPHDLSGRTAVVVDDGIATGATARAACQVARELGAARVVLATPVAPSSAPEEFPEADRFVAVALPRDFEAVGYHYRDFTPTTDDDVTAILHAAAT
ncbi:MAG: hypothetical protein GC157_10030 [Frankiales bacterium]|nr:hypothetical protein [Frankiales bacterium]